MLKKQKMHHSCERTDFGNYLMNTLYLKYLGNLNNSNLIEEVLVTLNHLYNCVKNFYELENNIPLMRYVNLIKNGAENYGFDESEYRESLELAFKDCHLYYGKIDNEIFKNITFKSGFDPKQIKFELTKDIFGDNINKLRKN